MSLIVWRIIQRKFATSAFTGDGARCFGGRWNSPGRAVVYTAQSLSLAALEILVHVDSEKLLDDYATIPVTIDERLITTVRESSLPNNWQAYPAQKATRTMGDEWLARGDSVVLQVPSAVISAESNFLIKPFHKGFRKLRIGKLRRFRLDPRLTQRP